MTDGRMRPTAIAALATAVALATVQGAAFPNTVVTEYANRLSLPHGALKEPAEHCQRVGSGWGRPDAIAADAPDVAAFGPMLAGAASAETGAATASGTVRIAGIVLKWIRGDKEANYRRLEPLVRQAAAGGAQIICTTECFLDGYAIADKTIPLETYRALGEPIPEGPYCRRLAALARELKIYLVAGLHEADGDKRCNTAVLLGPGGDLLGKYRKQMLEHESVRNTPGNSMSVFQTPFGRLGLIICADRRSPDIVRRMREAGADFFLCPSGGMFGPKANDPILQARSRENSVHIVFVHPAEFLVTGPDGSVLSQSLPGGRLLVRPDEAGSAADRNRVCYFDMPLPAAAGAGDGGARAARLRSAGRPWPVRVDLPLCNAYESWGQVTGPLGSQAGGKGGVALTR